VAAWKKALSWLFVTFLAVIFAGYATARISLASCAAQSFSDMEKHGVTGVDLDGHKIVLTQRDVHASVSGPFLVDVQYLVPYDLHGTLHVSNFVALPWAIYLRSANEYPLM
jgi:hypothetical protein